MSHARTAAPTTDESPRLGALRATLDAGDRSAVDRFWRDASATGTPLVEELPGAPDERLVTFLWRQDRPVEGVYALVNRVTDKHLAPRGMMRRLPDTDVWRVTLRLPVGLRCTYRIHPFGPGDPQLGPDGPRSGSSRGLPDDRSDPLNRHAAGPFGSLLEIGEPPSLADWLAPAAPSPGAGRTETFDLRGGDGETYRVRQFVPGPAVPGAGDGPPALLVVLDGEQWFDRFGIVPALASAVAAGRVRPVSVVGVEAGADTAARMRQLGANRRFVDVLADDLLPAVRARLPHPPARRDTVLCGQSLGGLTALVTALHRPDAFGTVLAHSASTWWRPGMTARPRATPPGEDTWLYEQAVAAPLNDVRIRVDVGSNEGTMTGDLRRLHTALRSRGFDSCLHVYAGGHDHACWAAALTAGLAEAAPPAAHPTAHPAARSSCGHRHSGM
ncbi:DUF3327 domain-containing protein [Streptomyces sp. SID5785]|uniref:alpha/beta hydrolase-fold protein n=1 Tax=Streptomyces sp. SID5785 TaxID=2690309 RepID=UPI0013615DA5|nr:alpha/beta hydrolase-fold protein [Streptomyces sp. SID5785]MZD05147.1 DUF3327 domain-containing protein [Streptomyces sp. SID5785]